MRRILLAGMLFGGLSFPGLAQQYPSVDNGTPPPPFESNSAESYRGSVPTPDLPLPLPYDSTPSVTPPTLGGGAYKGAPYGTMAPQNLSQALQQGFPETNPWLDPQFISCILDNLDRPKVDAAVTALYMACRGVAARR
ncbi:hypothetical protein JCM17960_28660 [Magnetospira thiophila]